MVVVAAIAEESPVGDVVLKVGSHTIATRLDLERAFWDRTPGQRVPTRILRQSEDKTLSVVLEPAANER